MSLQILFLKESSVAKKEKGISLAFLCLLLVEQPEMAAMVPDTKLLA